MGKTLVLLGHINFSSGLTIKQEVGGGVKRLEL